MIMKDVVGYEGLYKVTEDGQIYGVKRKNYLKQMKDRDGYLTVNLYDGSGGMKKYFVHRLVAIAFVPNPEGKATVNHTDENKANNHWTNLTWMTQRENNAHGTRVARAAAGECRPVRCIDTGVEYPSAKAAAEAYDTSGTCITKVCKGKARTHRGVRWEYVKKD